MSRVSSRSGKSIVAARRVLESEELVERLASEPEIVFDQAFASLDDEDRSRAIVGEKRVLGPHPKQGVKEAEVRGVRRKIFEAG